MDRPKILLLGAGPRNAYLAEILVKIGFADVEQRVLNDMMNTGTGFSRVIFDEHPRVCHVLQEDIYDWNIPVVAADHPSRKREPKGPRNKWGKIK